MKTVKNNMAEQKKERKITVVKKPISIENADLVYSCCRKTQRLSAVAR